MTSTTAPSVLLVHGAFADGSSWNGVIRELAAVGVTDVIAPANPLRGLQSDATAIAGLADALGRPVLFVGHSYGAAVSGVAAALAAEAVGIVSVAGFLVDEGESALDVNGRFPETPFGAALNPVVVGGATDLYLSLDGFRAAFAADVDEPTAALMARTQRAVAAGALEERAQSAGWRTLPTWAVVSTGDQAIHPDAQRFMAQRAEAEVTEVDASHAVAVSRPSDVAAVIAAAVRSPAPATA
jgi:pimeloyl-ACP methyl ester carboxylesterase